MRLRSFGLPPFDECDGPGRFADDGVLSLDLGLLSPESLAVEFVRAGPYGPPAHRAACYRQLASSAEFNSQALLDLVDLDVRLATDLVQLPPARDVGQDPL